MKKIKHIILDLGGVLLNVNYQKTIAAFKQLGVRNSERFYSKETQKTFFNLFECGKISENQFITTIQKKTNKASYSKIVKAWNSMIIDLPKNRLEVIKKLKKNYLIFLLSNTNSIHIKAFKKSIGFKKWNEFNALFNKIYLSYEMGLRKPDLEIFNLVLKENKLKATNVLFVDDSIQHIKGAEKVGLKCHHLKENEDIITLFPHIIQKAHR